ncbi:hypothetical protein J003_01443 [Cryptococcus neoformans]|nr:hypothetical protein J009_01437 [Cryptococcus neoformans var. grubii]OXH57221.1 hypothetical protein J003_01443 [Cryptococcus neoformans var. grubii]OXH57445.1 hypothetical protein J004_01479 [Cryptococcus neoformans var. grubii]OXH73327.1 hypothetical protein J000_01438 [Cryptococcus neoformans var. grubii]OXH74176.1 hypothetical protein J001_01446 [Cryptococcus neoformans var. grubii]
MQGIYSEQVHHQSAANDQVEQDVMDDADGEEDEDGASEVVTREERTQLMAEVNGIEEFVRLRKDLGYDDAGILNFEDMGDGLGDFTAQAVGIQGFSVLATNFKTTLASLSLRHFQEESPAPRYGVVTNHESKIQYATLLRNKDVDRCPVSFLALMLFARFHSSRQSFPNSNTSFPFFKICRDWYPIPLFVTPQSNYLHLKYGTLNSNVLQALLACDIYCKASANPSRKWGTQLAGQGRAPEEEIPRHGRWCRKAMETTTSTTSQAMRILVGLPSKKGAYHLPRDVDVPKELRVIWFSLGPTTPELNDPNRQEDDKAGRTFVELLRYLSKVIVQDAPFLRRFVPDLYVWKEPFFSAPSFVAFEAKTLAEVKIAQTTTTSELPAGAIVPLAELLKTVLEERRSEQYDALLAGIGGVFHTIARDLRHQGLPGASPPPPSIPPRTASPWPNHNFWSLQWTELPKIPAVHRDGNERPTFPFHEMYISPGFCSNGGVPEEHLPEAARQHIRDSEVVDPDVIQSGGHSGENVSYLPVTGPSVAVKKVSYWVLSCLMGIVKWSQESDPSGPKALLQKAKDAERLMRERDQHLKQRKAFTRR